MVRKSFLAVAIGASFCPGVQLAASRVGPISPYISSLNQEAYYRLLGSQVWRARSVGKTRSLEKSVLLPYHYQLTMEQVHDREYQILIQKELRSLKYHH
jgi:hypothetical protein